MPREDADPNDLDAPTEIAAPESVGPAQKSVVVDPVPCSGCGRLIDPLRAGHVAIFDLKFHYFCSREGCRAIFLGEVDAPPPPARREVAQRPTLDAPIVNAHAAPADDAVLPEPHAMLDDRLLVEPIGQTILTSEPVRHEPDPRDAGALLLLMAVISGALAVAIALAGDAKLVLVARVVLAGVGAIMLVGRAATTPRDVSEPHPAAVLASSVVAIGVAAWAALGRDGALAAEAASLAGILVTASAVGAWLHDLANRPIAAERAWIADELHVAARRVGDDGEPAKEKVHDLRAGESVVVEPGEVVPADVVVTGGDVDVLPWIGATTAVRRRKGEAIVAGGRVVHGKLRGVCTAGGNDRAFARLLLDPRRRADALVPLAQASRSLVERWAIAATIIGAVSAVLARRIPIEVAMIAVAVHGALATSVTASVAAVHVARGVLLGLRRGIVYKSADAWDRAARVVVAMFCARGTLLLGEPELSEIEVVSSKLDASRVLALAAGAERGEEHPIGRAILRAAKTRSLKPDGVRNPTAIPGQGVAAIASTGEELVVGGRSLLLDQRISIAASEQRIAELEGLGRTVVLVALGQRLIGLLALQDGLRPGARAAVQHLLDVGIEPILVSGDARETCEAIGRSLDIEHIRPEVMPSERGAEVKRLLDTGLSVAVFGHGGADDAALAAADVSVALASAGAPPGDFAITLASDDVRDAALALALARRTRDEARVGTALSVVPALLGAITISFGILPPAYAPIASLLGGAIAALHARSLIQRSA